MVKLFQNTHTKKKLIKFNFKNPVLKDDLLENKHYQLIFHIKKQRSDTIDGTQNNNRKKCNLVYLS